MNSHTDWYLEGEYLESCNCTTVCPCIWLNPPSEGECKLLVGWQIRKGHYGATDLAGRSVALACYAAGPMHQGGWQVVLYLDQRVDADQWLALERIFGGQPALLMGLVDKVLGVHLADIRIDGEGRRRRLTVAGVAETEIEAIEGIRGGPSTIDNPPVCGVQPPVGGSPFATPLLLRYPLQLAVFGAQCLLFPLCLSAMNISFPQTAAF